MNKDNNPSEKWLPCVSLIGMPGCGKSTIGSLLAKNMNWAYMDTDFLLESLYACKLQHIVDNMTQDEFRDAEADMIQSIKAHRSIIATGGSVIYRPEAIRHLKNLGPLVYIESGLDCLKERIALNPQRGISIKEGQSLEDLYQERKKLYEKYADLICNSEILKVAESAEFIQEKVKKIIGRKGKYFHD